MTLVLSLQEVSQKEKARIGGKGFALALLLGAGLRVPKALCVSIEAYQQYVSSTGLRDQMHMELYRKPFEEMRWEEIWDTALRVRNMFIRTPLPITLQEALRDPLSFHFSDRAVSVRSSAPGEDSSKTSFAGLHESFVNVRGVESILEHIRLVWASLWSDRALLYRRELGLDLEGSNMAVLVQEMVPGERSGVVFGMSPVRADQTIIEAVYGLNQGLVDGTVQPDRWILERGDGKILAHHPTRREKILMAGTEGVCLAELPTELRNSAPLRDVEVEEVYRLAITAEALFGSPQDVEWTYSKEALHALQARPITKRASSSEDQRPWYLSLHRSFDNLKSLRTRLEKEVLPGMEEAAQKLSLTDLTLLSHAALAREIGRRRELYKKWMEIYRRDCIPFAHGVRLFGKVYNDLVKPEDPFQFTALLGGSHMISLRRNHMLQDLAEMARENPRDRACILEQRLDGCSPEVREALERILDQFGDLAWEKARFGQDLGRLLNFIMEMPSRPQSKKSATAGDLKELEEEFLACFEEGQRPYALELLDLARASYLLRDDDNIFLGKIEGQVLIAVEEGKRRLEKRESTAAPEPEIDELARALGPDAPRDKTVGKDERSSRSGDFFLKARQMLGQPAGAGIAMGKARVVLSHSDLFNFQEGEILVCDAIDPGMTFVVPLASGIVERRGGMLIHGAIIAREYGIPCVTGVAEAASLIRTGDTVTVDGFLGIVIVGDREKVVPEVAEQDA